MLSNDVRTSTFKPARAGKMLLFFSIFRLQSKGMIDRLHGIFDNLASIPRSHTFNFKPYSEQVKL